MALTLKFQDVEFGVGDKVRISQTFTEKDKERSQNFDGIVISLKKGSVPTFTVRKIGEAMIGIEKIFPLDTPTLKSIKVIRSGHKGTNKAKLYFIRNKPKKEIDKIYFRADKRK
jgi:large subunit ribosomal protein L19